MAGIENQKWRESSPEKWLKLLTKKTTATHSMARWWLSLKVAGSRLVSRFFSSPRLVSWGYRPRSEVEIELMELPPSCLKFIIVNLVGSNVIF